ncbi:MAG TPA: ROK family transcriptional regulator [Aggregatilineales bacterium]|nr:ROK family transcriptional regulator [Aggregatilineales bacterium]
MLQANRFSKVTATHLKQHNETLILREIYAHKSISRVKLAQLTGLSRPSVTELTQGLIKKGLINEVGPERVTDKVGKRPTLLAFNPDASQIIAIVIGDTQITGSLLNLRVKVIEEKSLPMDGAIGEVLVSKIFTLVDALARRATQPLLGISVGTPGIVDSIAGIIHLATNLGWRDLPLADRLSDHFRVNVYVGNDSNLAVVGEHRFGLARDIRDLIVVKIGTGMGAGILTDGNVVHGSTHGAGELGHIPFPPLNDVCICGQRGCLETLVSWWGLRRYAQRIADEHPDSLLHQLADGGEVSVGMLHEALSQGDPWMIDLVKEAAKFLGLALIVMIHLLNPTKIILTGSMVQLGEIFLKQVQQTVDAHGIAGIVNPTEIIANALDDKTILLGAGARLLEMELGL